MRADAVLLDRCPQRRSRAEDVLLADELVESPRPYARGERRVSPPRAPPPRPRRDLPSAKVCSRDACRRSRRSRLAAPGADPPRHREPAGERDGRGRAAARVPRGERRRMRALRAHPGPREPRRADSWTRNRAVAPPALAHGHGARRSVGVVGRSVVGRGQGRLHLGPGRARHEGPGGGERCRHRLARAGGVRAGRRPDLLRDGGRGGRRGRVRRASLAVRDASRRRALRLRAQRGIRRPARARRPRLLPVRAGGEDVRPFHPGRARTERPRIAAGHRGQRARQGRRVDRADRGVSRAAAARPRDGSASCSGSRARRRPRRALSTPPVPSTKPPRRWSSRC